MDPAWMEERVQAKHLLLWCFPLEAGPWPRGSGAAQRKALAVGRPRFLDHCRQHGMTWVFQKLHDMEIQNGIKMASWERISIMGGVVHPSASGLASSCRQLCSQTCKKTDIEKQTSSIISPCWVMSYKMCCTCKMSDFPLFAFPHWQRWRWWEATSFRLGLSSFVSIEWIKGLLVVKRTLRIWVCIPM